MNQDSPVSTAGGQRTAVHNPRVIIGECGITLEIETGGWVSGYTIALSFEQAAELGGTLLKAALDKDIEAIHAAQHVSADLLRKQVDV